MKKLRLLAIAGLFVVASFRSHATTFSEDFASDPLQHGWQVFGNTNLFTWDSTNHDLMVTWDSSQPNSYFFHPLGTILARTDDFSFSFDLTLLDAGTGDSTGPLSLGIGFLNLRDATEPGFERGAGISPNIAEFDYYPAGFYPPSYPSPATAVPSFVDQTSSAFAPADLSPYDLELPTNVLIHVEMDYTSSNQTVVLTLTTNGVLFAQPPGLSLSSNSTFAITNDYRVGIFSITSFSEAGQFPPYVASILAHGIVANLAVSVPPPPVQDLTGSINEGVWQAQFLSNSNWTYTLERTPDFQSWTNVSTAAPGTGTNLILQDLNPPPDNGFYRISATRP